MNRLLVLSEIDCRRFLEQRDIYPSEFYTDFSLFKNKVSTFIDVDIIIIYAGSCRFSKRHVTDLIKNFMAEGHIFINSVTVFSDVFLPSVSKYYKFRGSLSNISEYSGWKLICKDSDILEKIPKGDSTVECKNFFTDYDLGNVKKLKEEYINQINSGIEGGAKVHIKKPNFIKD